MQITWNECALILQNCAKDLQRDDLQLRDFQLEVANNVVGYLGEYYWLILNYKVCSNENTPEAANDRTEILKLFVKALPQESVESAKELIFEKEIAIYASLLCHLQQHSITKWCPKCYYTRPDLIVLEDISALQFAVLPRQLAGNLDDTRMRELLNALAAMHAASLSYEQRNQLNIGVTCAQLQTEISIAENVVWYTQGVAAIVAVITATNKYQTAAYKDFIATQLHDILALVYEMTNASAKYVNVCCHRDPWLCNALFSTCADNTSTSAAILVDYQTCRYCPPSVDIVLAIYLNCTPAQRQANEHIYLNYYYDALQRALAHFDLQVGQYLTRSSLWESYEEFRLLGSIYNAVVATIIRVPAELVTNDYKYVNRAQAVLRYMHIDSAFRSCMLQASDDVMTNALQLQEHFK